ncbi:hypothetical protein AB6805_13755 [Chitinophaga sp. RCC_12]|uniref:DUF6630 family protein n=1 Tax=Chitinophaga sp. RCC_12 TaxID=3239226 RepID=UPI003525D476
MNTRFSQLLMGAGEQEAFTLCPFTNDQELLDYLLKHQILLLVDWKGEEDEQQIGRFLQGRAAVLSPGATLDLETPYAKLKDEIDRRNIQTGDSVPFLLKKFQAQQKTTGLTVVLLDRGNDSYYIGLMKQSDTKELKKQTDLDGKFVVFGSLSGEVLYTVNCSCGSMNVWQVKRGEIITEDVCQDCGKELFDKEGKSPFQIIKDYI